MDHPTQLSWALANDAVYPYRGPLSTSGIENLRDGDFRENRGAFRIEIGNDGWSWPTARRSRRPRTSRPRGCAAKALNNALRYQASRHIRLASLVEQPPDPENRVTLDPDAKDIYGVPRPRLTYRLDDYTKAGFAASVAAHDEIFAKLGATDVKHSPMAQGAGHIIGTARMGDDREDLGGRPRPAQPRPREPLHPRLGGVPDIGDRQPDADHRRADAAGGRPGEGDARRRVRGAVRGCCWRAVVGLTPTRPRPASPREATLPARGRDARASSDCGGSLLRQIGCRGSPVQARARRTARPQSGVVPRRELP